MKVKLWDGEIELPHCLNLEERMGFVSDILRRYPDNFEYVSNEDTNHVVMIRLDILGSYILRASDVEKKEVMSPYKIKNRPYQDLNLTKVQELKNIAIGF
jgi:hypothetical protein